MRVDIQTWDGTTSFAQYRLVTQKIQLYMYISQILDTVADHYKTHSAFHYFWFHRHFYLFMFIFYIINTFIFHSQFSVGSGETYVLHVGGYSGTAGKIFTK